MPQVYIAAFRLVKIIAKDFAGCFGIIPQLLQVMEEPVSLDSKSSYLCLQIQE
ncbi:uncharacterized protein ACHE_50060A [Aspergillus chevalieri]|uniref:Uncharacterized protein n=1 Tax=Aspergillus chevalieri TaxID=182096 RepID=A0A7R7ZQ20_ASPCH|nr:uncharacterized protein ACHE_50060A [Aspergillus chevalieri]BCR88862.1 hypothetical protein ACHE_50060A [Aspergillus chevalieri]